MKYIFIENYLQLSNKQRISFFKYLKENKCKILEEDIIFEEEAMLLSFKNNIEDMEELIKNYFKINNKTNINIDIVRKYKRKFDKTILTYTKINKSILI